MVCAAESLPEWIGPSLVHTQATQHGHAASAWGGLTAASYRYNDAISCNFWLIYGVTILGCLQGGGEHPIPDFQPLGAGFIGNYSLVNLENVGRETNTLAQHIIVRYESLADYTVFTQVKSFLGVVGLSPCWCICWMPTPLSSSTRFCWTNRDPPSSFVFIPNT